MKDKIEALKKFFKTFEDRHLRGDWIELVVDDWEEMKVSIYQILGEKKGEVKGIVAMISFLLCLSVFILWRLLL